MAETGAEVGDPRSCELPHALLMERLQDKNERLRQALYAAVPWIECICYDDEGTGDCYEGSCDGCRARVVAQAALREA